MIVSYRRDVEFLTYALRSIAKFATGFSGTTVVFPEQDREIMLPALAQFQVTPRLYPENRQSPFNHHQAMKCQADLLCPAADFILHMDSDCLFNQPVCPADYFDRGKPVLLKEAFAEFGPGTPRFHQNRYGWKEVTEKALGFPIEFETMVRHPAVHPRWIYPALRSHIEQVHGVPFIRYVLDQKDSYPQGFTEFPALGAYAIKYAEWCYHWVDIRNDVHPPNKLTPFWTRGGTEKVREKLEAILAHETPAQ